MRRALIRLAAAAAVGLLWVAGYGAFRIWQQGLQDERRPAGAVVVLGAAQYNGRPSPIFESRLRHAVELFQTGDYRFLMVTGGKQPGDVTTEAAAARQFAIEHGVPANRILMEDHGRNTRESLDAVRTTLAAESIHDAVFVSDRSHMLRVLRIAADLGISAYGSPAPDSPGDTDPIHVIEITFHELGGLAVYFVTGNSPAD
jgi:uncharacterized SAM-binding protein YcdF (DUF218 family)